jgi:hypothetical protein
LSPILLAGILILMTSRAKLTYRAAVLVALTCTALCAAPLEARTRTRTRQPTRRVTTPRTLGTQSGQLGRLRRYMLSAPPARLAGRQRDLLRSSKIDELLHAARTRPLSDRDVATFAQSVHPRLLQVFEKGAGLSRGYFLTVTRGVQFPGGNPFKAKAAPAPARQRVYRDQLVQKLMGMVKLHRKREGKLMPHALQLLTSTSHLVAPGSPKGDLRAVRRAVDQIPALELKRRHSFMMKLSSRKVLSQMPSRKALRARGGELVNFDHLLGALGKVVDGKLLVEIYSENVPGKKRVDRFLPVTALGEGSYCVDDIARTTVALLQQQQHRPRPKQLARARAGLDFVRMMQAADGEFYNFASLAKGKLRVNKTGATSKKGIDFWAARALWAMGEGYTALRDRDPKQARALSKAFVRSLPHLEAPLKRHGRYRVVKGHKLPAWLLNDAADQTGVALKGLLAFHRGLKAGPLRDRVAKIIAGYADGIAAAQITNPRAKDVGRFIHSINAPEVTHLWGSRQVEVLAEAARALGGAKGQRWLKAARRCADGYWARATPASIVSPGEEQIAYGMETVVSGYARLYEATGEQRYAKQTYRWASWFFGNNKAKAVVYDPISGRGYDGIRPVSQGKLTRYSVNINSGAESTVESLLALQSARRVPGVHQKLTRQLEQMLPR